MSWQERWTLWRTPSRILRIVCAVILAVALVRASLPFLVGESQEVYEEQVGVLIEDVVVRVETGDNRQKLSLQSGILAFVPRYPSVSYGDRVRLQCDLSAPEPFDGFAYDRYLAAKGIDTLCYSRQEAIILAHGQGGPIMGGLQYVREALISRIELTFGEPQGALLAGLLFGEKRFSDEWKERFIQTGTSHIVAASGYNVAMVLSLAAGAFFALGLRRQRAFALLLAAVAGYVLFAGMETAVVRAGVMAMLVLCAKQVGRKTTMTNALLLTAAIMLTVNPLLLFDDVAFSLSFLSTIGLIYLAPVWQQRWKWIPNSFTIRESFTCTLAATLMSLPIILFQFGHISLVSIVTNVLILPAIPYVMVSGSIATLVSLLSPFAAQVISLPAVAGLNWMLWVVQVSAQLPLYLSIPVTLSIVIFLFWLFLLKNLWTQNVLRLSSLPVSL